MKRVLEPEVMDTWEETIAYDAMDFTEVNQAFVEEAIALSSDCATVLDVGTGPARIPILLCQRRPRWTITAIDLSHNMLKLGATHVAKAELGDRIRLDYADAKSLPYADASFDLVISNSIIHHLEDPLPGLQELRRVLKPQGGLLLRDLVRPDNLTEVERLVQQLGSDYDPHQTQLFQDSLCAAFSLSEIQQILEQAGFTGISAYLSSDRHWTAKQVGQA
ncbi:class I SAM-dependent methyltransferase [Geitlerinema sp. P-1104]|uniref:class I SAM-dependent methyltransferase n=1 Tax=Geitlerinema sp. P-1104 TaxID=2546230 RepID=UPI0014772956|nr:class I SAM-dependent methyltransferase [Geitlerinema sp. P-1104]NMG57886.1 class I SAM-dependent methyltransferase [Geitlerinema sp. P-1104]